MLGGKGEKLLVQDVVKRLDPKAVAGAEEQLSAGVVEHEGPHAVEPVEQLGPPVAVGGQQHFGVALGAEQVAVLLELRPELQVVVDLTVEHDPHVALGGGHWLVPRRRHVQDAQAAVAQAEQPVGFHLLHRPHPFSGLFGRVRAVGGSGAALLPEQVAFIVRPAVAQGVRHRLQHPGQVERVLGKVNEACDAAHVLEGPISE